MLCIATVEMIEVSQVRRLIRAVTVMFVAFVLVVPTVSAETTLRPNREEWWFDSMAIQSKAWPYTKGKGTIVAVLDTGVNADLPEFRGGVVLPGISFIDGGDGRRDTDPYTGHGTGMASLIAGQGSGQSGWVGVAPEAKILPIAINIASDDGPKAIRYAVDHGAKVINMSLGSAGTGSPNNCPQPIQDAVAYAVKHDVVLLAAAGNDGDTVNIPNFPASCPGVIAVGAFDHNGNPWAHTERQNYVSLAGAGVQVGSLGKDGRLYHYGDGTSQATAIVSGAVSLFRAKFPNESAKQIIQRIIATTTDLGPPGKDDQLGYGAISLRNGMTANVPSSAPNPVYDRLDKALAAQSKQPRSDSSSLAASSEKSSSNPSTFLLIGSGSVIVVAVLLIVIFMISRTRRMY